MPIPRLGSSDHIWPIPNPLGELPSDGAATLPWTFGPRHWRWAERHSRRSTREVKPREPTRRKLRWLKMLAVCWSRYHIWLSYDYHMTIIWLNLTEHYTTVENRNAMICYCNYHATYTSCRCITFGSDQSINMWLSLPTVVHQRTLYIHWQPLY